MLFLHNLSVSDVGDSEFIFGNCGGTMNLKFLKPLLFLWKQRKFRFSTERYCFWKPVLKSLFNYC